MDPERVCATSCYNSCMHRVRRVEIIYFKYSGKQHHKRLLLYVVDLCPTVVENCK